MNLLEISTQYRVIIGIVAMVILFSSFLISFISSQRKKLVYHKHLQAMQEQQQQELIKQNALLEQRVSERTAELSKQKEILQTALIELKDTQEQLIHREKMASLGELTAGIAHEIQNPLNFVNNFADVNSELIDELQSELKNGNITAAMTVSNDIKDNADKINQHGKRADSIVKGMLQHSRTSTGEKEPADINALANEFMKLSYYGLRAKDKGFNATLVTDFDESIPKINIVPQEVGRVMLNLYNNAFFAVAERIKTGDAEYVPTVSVTTKKLGKDVEIRIKDNGTGISKDILDKIFQPFFTTKSAGQGTGLGLSLSYDIIKSHGGKITVQSEKGSYTEFIISLPL